MVTPERFVYLIMAAAKRVETHMATSCGFAHGILVFQTVFSKAFYSRNLRRLQTRIALFVWHFQVTLKKMKTSALWTSIGIGNGSFLPIPFLCQFMSIFIFNIHCCFDCQKCLLQPKKGKMFTWKALDDELKYTSDL